MMDESAIFPEVEVHWDCDSPTPSAWKNLQAPKRSDDELQCSPQLARTKKRVMPRTARVLNDRPGCEQSRNEVFQIIDALRRASREGCQVDTESSQGRKLLVPDIPEEDESEDEKEFSTAPVFKASLQTNTNASIDLLFDMSGGGEDLAPTATNKNSTKPYFPGENKPKAVAKPVSPHSADAWTDDDLFADDVLMSEMDKIPNAITPAKLPERPLSASTPLRQRIGNSGTAATSCETDTRPRSSCSGKKSQEVVNINAKGFLDFFMDSGRPAKPSPEKGKSKVFSNTGNWKFSKKANTNVREDTEQSCRPLSAQASTSIVGNCRTEKNMGKEAPRKEPLRNTAISSTVKPMDTSIPLDILEELIAEDSWAEGEETPQKPTNGVRSKPIRPTNNGQSVSDSRRATSRTITDNTNGPGLKRSHTLPLRKNFVQSRKKEEKIIHTNPTRADDTGGFSSEDEEFLLEAVALSESQQPSNSGGPDVKVTKTSTSKPSSQPKCTPSQIEAKKRMAMQRRMKNKRN